MSWLHAGCGSCGPTSAPLSFICEEAKKKTRPGEAMGFAGSTPSAGPFFSPHWITGRGGHLGGGSHEVGWSEEARGPHGSVTDRRPLASAPPRGVPSKISGSSVGRGVPHFCFNRKNWRGISPFAPPPPLAKLACLLQNTEHTSDIRAGTGEQAKRARLPSPS
jgi:hypothetical protein